MTSMALKTIDTILQEGNGAAEQLARTLTAIAAVVPPKSYITLEGTPLYCSRPWDRTHEFGTNLVLPAMRTLLTSIGCDVHHYILIDDYTEPRKNGNNPQKFLESIQEKPPHIFYESAYVEDARQTLARLGMEEKILEHLLNPKVFLRNGTRPMLWTASDRPSCALLDACFQQEKLRGYKAQGNGHTGYHIIIHPITFAQQQAGMRHALQAIYGGVLPGTFVNVYFSGQEIRRVELTDTKGKTEKVQL